MPLVGELLPIKHSNPLPNNVIQTHFCHSNSIKRPQVKLTSGLWQVFVCSFGINWYQEPRVLVLSPAAMSTSNSRARRAPGAGGDDAAVQARKARLEAAEAAAAQAAQAAQAAAAMVEV